MQSHALGPVDPDERVEVSLIVRPRRPLGELESRLDQPMSREAFAASYGAAPDDLARVEAFAVAHRLEVLETSAARRTVRLGGRAADVERAFGVRLQRWRLEDGTAFRMPDRPADVPDEVHGVVEGVFGLDTRPAAGPRE